MNNKLADVLSDPEAPGRVPTSQIPDIIAALESLKAKLICMLVKSAAVATPRNDAIAEQLITVAEAAHALSFTPQYLYELIRTGSFFALRQGKYIRIRLSDLKLWIQNRQGNKQDETSLDHNRFPGTASRHPRKLQARHSPCSASRSSTGS
jgi:excisionase family DNA binding protein